MTLSALKCHLLTGVRNCGQMPVHMLTNAASDKHVDIYSGIITQIRPYASWYVCRNIIAEDHVSLLSCWIRIHEFVTSLYGAWIESLCLTDMNKTCLVFLCYVLQTHLQGLAHAGQHVETCCTKNSPGSVSLCYKAVWFVCSV